MRLLLAITLTLCCCGAAPASPRPITLPSFGVQCMQTRSVVCALDGDFQQWQCDATVPPAIAAINAAAGRVLLRFDGYITMQGASNAYQAGSYVVYGDRDVQLPTLAVTRPELKGPCIVRVRTAVNSQTFMTFTAPAVVIHELTHGLGFDHASESNLASIEAPTVESRQAATHLTAADAWFNPRCLWESVMATRRKQRRNTRRKWGFTRYGSHEIDVYINSHDTFTDVYEGLTVFKKHGRVEIDIAVEIAANPLKFYETLCHEAVHVVEQFNSYADLSAVSVDTCTRLAQTMGQAFGQMLNELVVK